MAYFLLLKKLFLESLIWYVMKQVFKSKFVLELEVVQVVVVLFCSQKEFSNLSRVTKSVAACSGITCPSGEAQFWSLNTWNMKKWPFFIFLTATTAKSKMNANLLQQPLLDMREQ